jgi:hypothetical protein
MWLRSSLGEVVRGRCHATNLCDYCARLGAVENAEVLALDAMENAPQLYAVLTTRSPERDPAAFYRSREHVLRALRRRWPRAEYASLVEFTTGRGPRSGGRRRPHWNLLLKGIPADAHDQVADVIRSVWCRREDAEPQAQYVAPIAEAGGLMRYLALHFQKESQRPPDGWSGQRFNVSRGYLAGPMADARDRARAALRWKRELWRALQEGVSGEVAEEVAERRSLAAAAVTWKLVWPDLRMPLKRGPVDPAQRHARGAEGRVEREARAP